MMYSISGATDFHGEPWPLPAEARAVPAMSPVRIAQAPPGDGPTARQRVRIGTLLIDRRAFPRQQRVSATIDPKTVLIVVPAKGCVEVITPNGQLDVMSGALALLARPQESALVWSAGAYGCVVHLRRDRVQISASRHFGTPCRLAALDRVMRGDAEFAYALDALTGCHSTAPLAVVSQRPDEEERFHRALIASAEREGLAGEMFADVRSVREAVAHIRAHHQGDCSLPALAAIAGVTERTLRERFRQCFGLAVTTFVQEVRLDWAHQRLSSARESRSINELARAAGFASAGTFSKSYQRRFGEPATQTRGNAVRAMTTV